MREQDGQRHKEVAGRRKARREEALDIFISSIRSPGIFSKDSLSVTARHDFLQTSARKKPGTKTRARDRGARQSSAAGKVASESVADHVSSRSVRPERQVGADG